MILMAVAVVALITTGACWLLNTGQDYGLPAPAQSGPFPQSLADEMIGRGPEAWAWPFLLGLCRTNVSFKLL
jgi:hypothetical protein